MVQFVSVAVAPLGWHRVSSYSFSVSSPKNAYIIHLSGPHPVPPCIFNLLLCAIVCPIYPGEFPRNAGNSKTSLIIFRKAPLVSAAYSTNAACISGATTFYNGIPCPQYTTGNGMAGMDGRIFEAHLHWRSW